MFSLIAELKMQRFRSILRCTGSRSIQSWTGSGTFPSWTGSVSFLRWTGSGSFPSWTRSGSFLRWTGSGSDLGHQYQDLTLLVKWYLYNVLPIFFSEYFEINAVGLKYNVIFVFEHHRDNNTRVAK